MQRRSLGQGLQAVVEGSGARARRHSTRGKRVVRQWFNRGRGGGQEGVAGSREVEVAEMRVGARAS